MFVTKAKLEKHVTVNIKSQLHSEAPGHVCFEMSEMGMEKLGGMCVGVALSIELKQST